VTVPQLTATIVSLIQEIQLSNGEMRNLMLLRLANGTELRALIDDHAAEEIVRLSVDGRKDTIPSPPPSGMESPEDSVIFGGGDSIPEAPSPALPQTPAVASPSVPPPRPSRRPDRVERDEMGYPVVRIQGAVDPLEFTGSRDRDEDGVGQI
jgi:hypothetical protein